MTPERLARVIALIESLEWALPRCFEASGGGRCPSCEREEFLELARGAVKQGRNVVVAARSAVPGGHTSGCELDVVLRGLRALAAEAAAPVPLLF